MVDAVLFDLFETLVTEMAMPVRRASSLAAELGVEKHHYRTLWRQHRADIIRGRCSFRDALARIQHPLGAAPNGDLLDRLVAERVTQKTAVLHAPEPDLLETLATLRARRLKLAVVTNCFAEDVAGWDRSPLRPLFHVTVFSCTAGVAKPDPAIYHLACRELEILPANALYVGDGADDELAGARAVGLRTSRALWFLARWPHVKLAPEDPGLHRPGDVLDAAT